MSCDIRLLRRAFQLSGHEPLTQAEAEQRAEILCVDNEIFPHLLLKCHAYEANPSLASVLSEVTAAAPHAATSRNGQARARIAEGASLAAISDEIAQLVKVGVTMQDKDRLIAQADQTMRPIRDQETTAAHRWIGY